MSVVESSTALYMCIWVCVHIIYIYIHKYVYMIIRDWWYMLQHTETHRNALQRTKTHCNALQRTATHCNALQRTATHCNALQCTATHYTTLQHTATHCNIQGGAGNLSMSVGESSAALKEQRAMEAIKARRQQELQQVSCVAVHCSALQCVALRREYRTYNTYLLSRILRMCIWTHTLPHA